MCLRRAAALAAAALLTGCNPCGDMCEGFDGTIGVGHYDVTSVESDDDAPALPEGWSWDAVERTSDQVIVYFTDSEGNSHEAVYDVSAND